MRVTPPLSRGVLIAASEPSVKLARIFDLLVAAFDTMLSVVLTPVAVNEELELETVPLAMIGHGVEPVWKLDPRFKRLRGRLSTTLDA
jgi:hypothetical protein